MKGKALTDGKEDKSTKEETDKKIDELLKDLKEDLQGYTLAEARHSANVTALHQKNYSSII